MTQYNFGTIDPYVVDGVQLAGMLNQWRDAMHTWHRGPSAPSYVVPGMMWIDDSAGATAWRARVNMSPGVNPIVFTYNTTTGVVTVNPVIGSNLNVAALMVQANAPELGFFDNDNPVDQKRWAWTTNGVGALVLTPLTDGGGSLGTSFVFNRDGTMGTAPPVGSRIRGTLAGGFTVNTWVPLTINGGLLNDTGVAPTANTWTPPAGRWRVTGLLSIDTTGAAISARLGYGLNSTVAPTLQVVTSIGTTSAENLQFDDVLEFNGTTTFAVLVFVTGGSVVSTTGTSLWFAQKVK